MGSQADTFDFVRWGLVFLTAGLELWYDWLVWFFWFP